MANAPRRAQDMSRYVKMMHQDMASYGNLVLARCLQDMSGKGDLKWATLSCEAMWKSRCVRFINSLVWTPTRPHGPWWTLVDRVLWKFDEAVLAFLCRNCRFIHFHSLSFTFHIWQNTILVHCFHWGAIEGGQTNSSSRNHDGFGEPSVADSKGYYLAEGQKDDCFDCRINLERQTFP